ncbi:DNA cytosine methyltransferase [Nocardiopsis aegyptia]|uniref:DNA (cytosine-5-)-methyltransferase n=1 Tax=Nocardiopsis aegyptia TaxID=220378 RepID=A0A7Z0EJV8_9ACTN|nr:DNA cytosine methyltransferase [Nocardiopsis aegyptia]NYJ33443.1 DNA (cytosine-5)-methyltransferase 1 [Nocardiopsis aegyptia]
MATTSPLRTGSLCTGYGGLDLAVDALFDARPAWVADPAPGPSKILAHRWPHVTNLSDLHTIDWTTLPPVDILTAGFPCQPVSSSGHRRGISDDRWLFDDILTGLARMPERPALLIFENVRGLLTANSGEAMRRVIHGLARARFLARWRLLRASDVGAPHQRARVFLVARDALRERRSLGPNRGGPPLTRPADQALPPGAQHPAPGSRPGLDPSAWGRFAPAIRRWERTLGRPAPFPAEVGPYGPRISLRFMEWMMGLPDAWVTGGRACSTPLYATPSATGSCPSKRPPPSKT